MTHNDLLKPSDTFVDRHIAPREDDIKNMLGLLGCDSLDALMDQTIPADIRLKEPLKLGPPRSEREILDELRGVIGKNQLCRSLIGMGYYDTITPPVIQRNILENPGWYTSYTPYQAEISQGRLEALLNYQTMVSDLTGLTLANASLLDEGTAAAEAMTMCRRILRGKRDGFFVANDCHPQTLAVVEQRANPLGIDLQVGAVEDIDFSNGDLFGILLQYPNTYGEIHDYADLVKQAHDAGAMVVVATDLLALTLLKPPGEFGADIAIGNSQRFGVPMGYGGPHAAFMATHEKHLRQMPGRIIGVSKDSHGNVGYRMAVQTREQHIRREKATSNICTAQVLLANMAGMYAVYHGPEGLRRIAMRVHVLTGVLAAGLKKLGFDLGDKPCFDTLTINVNGAQRDEIIKRASANRINLRTDGAASLGVSLDELSSPEEVAQLWEIFAGQPVDFTFDAALGEAKCTRHEGHLRTSEFMTHPAFNCYHAEHEMLRYMARLQSRDISLTHSMIPLGSCTMKLNGTTEMLPITWPEFCGLHPFAPLDQAAGYLEFFKSTEKLLATITGLPAVTLQPNSGASGEHTGLYVIRAYHESRGEGHRDVCLIPISAHGTNPASSVMAGCRVVVVACDDGGNVDVADLKAKAEQYKDDLAALMITYPSTHGVFEQAIREICATIHAAGGQVYMDGANMNAQVGLCSPGDIGADVCHLNLHKTFAIPHGGGGPGVGPIAVAEHLASFLPGHPLIEQSSEQAIGPVSAAPWGSAGVLPISWLYIMLMGEPGLKKATQVAILNANYMAKRLSEHYPIVYTGANGRVAHEFIVDLRQFEKTAHVTPDDVCKRLMDFGFHAPTMSFPVAGTLMIEPTESESKAELDRLCDALIVIREEIRAIEDGKIDAENNPLKHAPHTAAAVTSDAWDHPYTREQAAYPAPWLKTHKYWPPVGRVDNVHGDRNLFCSCPSVENIVE